MRELPPLILLFGCQPKALADALPSIIEQDAMLSRVGVIAHGKTPTDVLYCGVTYAISIAEIPARLDSSSHIFSNVAASAVRSALSIDLGADMPASARIAPIVKAMLQVAVRLGNALGAIAAYWAPQNILSGFDYFNESIGRYNDGGPFPALPLIRFNADDSVGVRTSGLAWFASQEIEFLNLQMPANEAIHRLVRIVHDIATNGPVREATEVAGLEHGERLTLSPSADGQILNVRSNRVVDDIG